MKLDIGTENPLIFADKDYCFQVEPHLLFKPTPEALDNCIVNTLDDEIK
jgi:hypothetical protein